MKAVVEKKANLPATAIQYEAEASSGFENADASSFAIPFLVILQALSPQVKKKDGAYVEGAEEGMLFNTVTQELYSGDTGVEVIPCYYRRTFIEWAPRDSGGGYKGEYAPSDPIVGTVVRSDKGDMLPNGNHLSDTRVHYVLLVRPDGTYSPAVLSLASMQVKKSRQWMSKMEGIKFKNAANQMYTPPMFSHVYRLRSTPESNEKGSWYGWKIETVRMQEDPVLFEAAKEFKRQIAAGEVKEQQDKAPQQADDDRPAF